MIGSAVHLVAPASSLNLLNRTEEIHKEYAMSSAFGYLSPIPR